MSKLFIFFLLVALLAFVSSEAAECVAKGQNCIVGKSTCCIGQCIIKDHVLGSCE
ncbi:H-bracotoxin-Cf4 [Cotesia typhae]|uniref:H-bracotoxin-Cf4 n=1 Tax=Cotesia flavipes TaxID=89805 RepID=CF4_COTFL|nr:RecName: Full=H-bracotoxin-Cf4; Short=H-BCTX-Cf4; Flags: Precursor [Cotesia flavipes]UEP64248.1 immune modulation disulfide-rich toxin-host encapsulation disruptor (HED) [Cotesia flavipes]